MAAFCKQGNKHSGLLRYNDVSIGKLLPMFRRHFLISSTGFKLEFRGGERKLLCDVGNYLIIGTALYLRRLVFMDTDVRTLNCPWKELLASEGLYSIQCQSGANYRRFYWEYRVPIFLTCTVKLVPCVDHVNNNVKIYIFDNIILICSVELQTVNLSSSGCCLAMEHGILT